MRVEYAMFDSVSLPESGVMVPMSRVSLEPRITLELPVAAVILRGKVGPPKPGHVGLALFGGVDALRPTEWSAGLTFVLRFESEHS